MVVLLICSLNQTTRLKKIDSLSGVEKKLRDVFFDIPIEVWNFLVSLPANVADGLLLDVLLGANR